MQKLIARLHTDVKDGVIEPALDFVLNSTQSFAQNVTQIAINCKPWAPIGSLFKCGKREDRTPAVITPAVIL